MVSSLKTNADLVLALADQFKGLVDFANEIRKLGDIDNAAAEYQGLLADVSAKHDAASADLASVMAELDGVKAQLDAAKSQKSEQEADAEVRASTIIADAKQQADNIVKDAQAEATRLVSDANSAVSTAKASDAARAADALANINELNGRADTVRQEISDLEAQRDALAGEIDKMRASIRSILG